MGFNYWTFIWQVRNSLLFYWNPYRLCYSLWLSISLTWHQELCLICLELFVASVVEFPKILGNKCISFDCWINFVCLSLSANQVQLAFLFDFTDYNLFCFSPCNSHIWWVCSFDCWVIFLSGIWLLLLLVDWVLVGFHYIITLINDFCTIIYLTTFII